MAGRGPSDGREAVLVATKPNSLRGNWDDECGPGAAVPPELQPDDVAVSVKVPLNGMGAFSRVAQQCQGRCPAPIRNGGR